LQNAIDDDVVIGEELSDGCASLAVERHRAVRVFGIALVMDQSCGRDRGSHRRNAAVCQHVHVMHPEREERGDRPGDHGAQAETPGSQTPAKRAGRADQLRRVDH